MSKKTSSSNQRTSTRRRPSKDEQDFRHALSMQRSQQFFSLARTSIIAGACVFAVYLGVYLPVKASAGKTTTITYVANFLTTVKADVVVSWMVSAGSLAWAKLERSKRLKERREKDKRIEELELEIDPKRSSSELTPSGEKRRIPNDS